jgi:hypothetical protein
MRRASTANAITMIRIILKFAQIAPRIQRTLSLLVNRIGVSKPELSTVPFGGLQARFGRDGVFWPWQGNNFDLDIIAYVSIVPACREEGSHGGDLETSKRTTAPAPELNPRPLRAAVRSERHRWLGRRLLWGSRAFKGGNDAARPGSKYGGVIIGWCLVLSESCEGALETRNALGAPGRPGSRPTPKLSI